MAMIFNKKLTTDDYSSDAVSVSGLWQLSSDTIGFAFEQVTSLNAAATTSRIYYEKYTISTSGVTAKVDVSGSDALGFFNPSFVATASAAVLLCGYSKGGDFNPFTGFAIKESADAGATWANTFTGGGSYDTDSLIGLYVDQINGVVYAVTQSSRVGGYKINVHKRTGAGAWTPYLAFTGTATNNYSFGGYPNQCCLFSGGKALIVGTKFFGGGAGGGSVWALRSNDLTTWTQVQVVSKNDNAVRACKIARTSDNIVRLMVPEFSGAGGYPSAPRFCFSSDFGVTWSTIGIPPGMLVEDMNGQTIGWPFVDCVSFTLDGRARMYAMVPDISNQRLQMFRAWSTANTSWLLIETDTIADGSSHAYNPVDTANLPSSSIVVGSDIFRVVCAYVTDHAEAWMLKSAGGALAAGGRSGGGGTPRKYTED